MQVISAEEDRYLLQLADGRGWNIVAGEGVRSWASTFASIMRLDSHTSSRYPKLIFTRRRGSMPGREELPRTGWKPHYLTSIQIWYHPEVSDVVCELGPPRDNALEIVRMWLALSPVYHRTLESGGLPLHSALVTRGGKGFLLAAAGGIGKSTCCRRIPPPWEAWCDDTTLIVRDEQDQFQAHPLPTWSNYLWERSETTWDVQKHIPLSAIFFLEQGPTDEVIPVGKGQASVLITEAATQVCQIGWRNIPPADQRSLRETVFENTCAIARRIPAFRLRATMHGRFWEEMERALQQAF